MRYLKRLLLVFIVGILVVVAVDITPDSTSARGATSDLRGVWRNRDTLDGSNQLLNLRSASAFYLDFGASACGVDESGMPQWVILGRADSVTYIDNQAIATFRFRCLGGSDVEPFSVEFTFTLVDEDMLEDQIGEIWTR